MKVAINRVSTRGNRGEVEEGHEAEEKGDTEEEYEAEEGCGVEERGQARKLDEAEAKGGAEEEGHDVPLSKRCGRSSQAKCGVCLTTERPTTRDEASLEKKRKKRKSKRRTKKNRQKLDPDEIFGYGDEAIENLTPLAPIGKC